MRINEYKNMVEKMKIPEDMDRELKNVLLSDQKEQKKMKKNKTTRNVSVAVIAAFLIFGMAQTPLISNAAATIMNYFRYGFSFTESNGTKEAVNMKLDYLKLSENAPVKDRTMNSVDEVSDVIGIKLLNSTKEYKGKVDYVPSLSEHNKLMGITIKNNFYCIGDITDIKQNQEKDIISYDNGETYFTPIAAQITVRTDVNLTEKYQDNELGFVSENDYVDLDDISSDADLYEISSLGVKAVLFTVKTDGPIDWGLHQEMNCTNAVLVYNGVEYVYFGCVSHDTMKAFLDTLE